MIRISYQLNVQVSGGPRASHAGSVRVGAYDVIQVTVPALAEDFGVELQPATANDRVSFLMITANRYTQLTYRVNDPGGAGNPHILDAPQLLLGSGGVSLLDDAPESLFINNESETESATVQVLVGRDPVVPGA